VCVSKKTHASGLLSEKRMCTCWMVTAFIQTEHETSVQCKRINFCRLICRMVLKIWQTVYFSEVIVLGDYVTVIFASVIPRLCCKCKFQNAYRYLLIQFVDGSDWLYVIYVPGNGFVWELIPPPFFSMLYWNPVRGKFSNQEDLDTGARFRGSQFSRLEFTGKHSFMSYLLWQSHFNCLSCKN